MTGSPAISRPAPTPAGTRRARPGTSPSTSVRPPSRSPTTRTTSPAPSAFARDHGLRVAAQGTGHNARRYGDLGDILLIKTDAHARRRDRARDRGRARVGAGVTWGEVVGPAAEHGLAALAGSSHDVGIVGYIARRRHQLAGPQARPGRRTASPRSSSSPPTASSARVDRRHDPELFWAIRGGGGNFGVVTAIEFELLPITEVYAGALFFPYRARRRGAARHGAQWTATVPDEVTSVGRMLQLPPLPDIPELAPRAARSRWSRPRSSATEQPGAELLAPLRELGPEMDTFAIVTAGRCSPCTWTPRARCPGTATIRCSPTSTPSRCSALVAAVGPGTDSPLLSFEFRHLGGALGRRGEGSGALGALGGRYMTFAVGMLMDPAMAPPLQTAFAAAREALDVVDSGAAYLNFAESRVEPGAIFGERTLGRLREIRANVDPEGMFLANHSIDA